MITKAGIGNVRLYLFWSLLKIPRFFSITGNCKQKIWLKQLKAAPALDFSYFQHASKLVTHHTKEKARSHSDCGLFPLISRVFGIPAAKTIRRNTEQIRKDSRFKTQFYERIIEELSAHFYQREKAGLLPCFSCIPSLGKRSHT